MKADTSDAALKLPSGFQLFPHFSVSVFQFLRTPAVIIP